MKPAQPFGPKIDVLIPPVERELKDAVIRVTDTLALCKASAETVFDELATPDLVLEIYDRVAAYIQHNQDAPEGKAIRAIRGGRR